MINVKNLTLADTGKIITKDILSPWDRIKIGTVECITNSGVDNIIKLAHDAFLYSGNSFTKEDRMTFFDNAKNKLEEKFDYFSSLISLEGGKPIKDAQIEVKRAINGLELCKDCIKSSHGVEIPMNLNLASKNKIAIEKEFPRGVVFAVSAFNHPLNLIVHQIGPALAAGCPVIIKPSAETPASCYEFVNILFESHLPIEFCQMINVADHKVIEKFVCHEDISFLSFIGSSNVGWKLKSLLSPGSKCALEHGGVAPVILDNTIDLKKIMKPLVKACFYHAGQVCVSTQNIIVHNDVIDQFVDLLSDEVSVLKIGDPLLSDTDVGPLIRPTEVDRVELIVNEAIKNGANLIKGGKRISDTCYECTILKNPPIDSKVAQQEIFGPIVNIFGYNNIDEAIKLANHNKFAFQSSVFTNNLSMALYCYEKLIAKTVLINEQTTFRVDWMPFGGINHSGEGVGGIPYSYADMSYKKTLIIDDSL